MSTYADLKANIIVATDSLSVYDGTNRITITPTTLSGTSLILSNANLSGTTTGVTQNVSDNSSKLATTAFVQQNLTSISVSGYATTANLSTEFLRATAAEALKENASNKSINVSTHSSSDTMYPSVKAVKTYVDTTIATIPNINSSVVSIGQTASGSITLNNPITVGYTYPITDKNLIGYIEKPTVTWNNTNFSPLATSSTLPIGVYSLTWSISLEGNYFENITYLSTNVYSLELDAWRTPFVKSFLGIGTNWSINQGCITFYNEASRFITLNKFYGSTQTLAAGYFNIARIA